MKPWFAWVNIIANRYKRRRKRSYAVLRGLDQLYGPRNTKRQADHRAERPRRRDRRDTRAEVGAGLLDRGTLRYGRRLRGTGRRSHERPPPGDQQLYGHHTNHHAPSLRRARDVGHPPKDRLSRPTSEYTPSRSLVNSGVRYYAKKPHEGGAPWLRSTRLGGSWASLTIGAGRRGSVSRGGSGTPMSGK